MKKLIRALIVIAAMVVAYLICNRILMLKSEDGIEQMEAFYLQEEGTVDVIFLGSSHIYCDVNTGVLWDNYGISGFDLGGAEQELWNSYYFLKEALKHQRPKVVVLDVTTPGVRSVEYQPEVWSVTNLFGMRMNSNRVDATRVSVPNSSFERLMISMNTMHTRYDELTKDDFVDENRSVNYKGFDLRDRITPFEAKDMTYETECVPVTEKEEEYLRKIIALSKEENVPLLLISVPFPVHRYEIAQKQYNYEFAIAEEEGIPYYDFNKNNSYEKIGLDFEHDFADEMHLNTYGNEKFSKYFGQWLADNYQLADHRGDSRYKSWEKDALYQRQDAAWVDLGYTENPGDYLMKLLNDQYIVFAAFGGGAEMSDFIYENRNVMNRLGITSDFYISNQVMILNEEKLIYASADENQHAFIDQGDMKLLLDRKTEDGSQTSTVRVNEQSYSLDTDGFKILVYDKQLKRIVSEREFALFLEK